MNKIFFSILLVAGLSISFGSCNSGAYVANPSSNANGSVNPLNPLTAKQFNWAGTSLFSVNINGSQWVADTAYIAYVDSLQTNYIFAQKGQSIIVMYLANVWGNNVYNMGFKQYSHLAEYADSFTIVTSAVYQSALGNSGELYMTENDSAFFKGQFYFQGVNAAGNVYNFSNGYFNLPK